MASAGDQTVTASAPGKVLLIGGYLVLHRPHQALVAGASSRFHCTASVTDDASASLPSDHISLRVVSPQFHSDTSFCMSTSAPFTFHESKPASFIELAVRVALLSQPAEAQASLASFRASNQGIRLDLRSDNDFYSQIPHLQARGIEVTPQALRAVPRCQPPPTEAELAAATSSKAPAPDTPAIRKTGLGSSAALTVSTVAALLGLLARGAPPKDVVMRCSQVAHGLAQGKVGSGFDVSAAVMGTQLYTRVSRASMSAAMDKVASVLAGTADPSEAATVLHGDDGLVVWNHEVLPARLPRSLDLLLADVSGGSSTPSMVRKVEAWRETETGAAAWERVAAATAEAQAGLSGVADAEEAAEAAIGRDLLADGVLSTLAATPVDEWTRVAADESREHVALFVQACIRASCLIKHWRALMREMGEGAGVPVEPETQTALLDATEALPGVLAAAVPGAGGFDAIYALTIRNGDTRRAVEESWMSHTPTRVVPLSLRAEPDDLELGGVTVALGEPEWLGAK